MMLNLFKINAQNNSLKSLFCYGDFNIDNVENLDYVVVEPTWFSQKDVSVLKNKNKAVLAYISLGEVNESAKHYELIKNEALSKNSIWNSYVLDIEATKTRLVLLNLIDELIATKGYQGLFLDNVDNYTLYGPTPEKKGAFISFIQTLKDKYPTLILMQNAGIEIVNETKNIVDVLAIESIATNYNFNTKTYQLRSKKEFKNRLDQVKYAQKTLNKPVIAIEYANTASLAKKVMKRLKETNFSLFIAEVELQKIPKAFK